MTAPEVILTPDGTPDSMSNGGAARHLRQSLAQRHVALPVPLADALARFLAAAQPMRDPVWGRAFSCMSRSLDLSGPVAGQALMRMVRDRFVLVVAEPVLRHAARTAGRLPLPTPGSVDSADTAAARAGAEAEAAIVTHAEAALAVPEVMGRPFWVHAALDLHLAAVQAARRQARLAAFAPPAAADPPLAALVFLHAPAFDADRHVERLKRQSRMVSARRRAGIRPKEGGVAGIRPSRSLDDIPDMMFSEFAQPRAVFANKLLHEGLLVRHRPPRRDPKRDLLALTLSEAAADDGMGCLVKAAWADAAIRLQIALHQMGLGKSDLAWSQGDGLAAHLDCALDDPGLDRMPPLALTGRARADRLMRSGLMPGFAALGGPGQPDPEALRPTLNRALGAVMGPGRTRNAAADYGRRMLLVCRPLRGRQEPDWIALRAELAAAARRDLGACHHAALAWRGSGGRAPDLIAMADGREDMMMRPPALDAADRPAAIAAFLGELSFWMMSVTLEALDAG